MREGDEGGRDGERQREILMKGARCEGKKWGSQEREKERRRIEERDTDTCIDTGAKRER